MISEHLKLLYLSSFPPRECGIATFTQNYLKAIQQIDLTIGQEVIAINEKGAPLRNYPAYVRYKLQAEEPEAYDRAASYINESGANLFCLQHEFGLFGGLDGIFLLSLLEKVRIPLVTFLHTIPVLKKAKRRNYRLKILKNIGKFSKFIIVTADVGKKILIRECHIPKDKFVIIRHGVPSISYPSHEKKEELKRKYNLQRKFIISSYGLISKLKGLDIGIEALSKLIKKYPQLIFLIIGITHPVKKRKGEDTQRELQNKVMQLDLKSNVLFINRYLEEKELDNYLKMSDIFLLPSLTKEQISSGTLARAMAAGTCIVSTPFVYAKELIGKDRGYFIAFGNSGSIVRVISDLIDNPKKIERARRKAYDFTQKFTWTEVTKKIIKVFQKAIKK